MLRDRIRIEQMSHFHHKPNERCINSNRLGLIVEMKTVSRSLSYLYRWAYLEYKSLPSLLAASRFQYLIQLYFIYNQNILDLVISKKQSYSIGIYYSKN